MASKPVRENLIVLMALIIASLGTYSFVWIARVSRTFGDDPVTNVVLSIVSGGGWLIFLYLRYLSKAEQLNGREVPWYYVIFVLLSFGFLAPLMIQLDLNEYVERSAA